MVGDCCEYTGQDLDRSSSGYFSNSSVFAQKKTAKTSGYEIGQQIENEQPTLLPNVKQGCQPLLLGLHS